MKFLLLYSIPLLFIWKSCSLENPSATTNKKIFLPATDTIDFDSQVKPIMVKNCSPCHFPGGKMYDKLPFDKDTTIINHEKGILKRIKGDDNLLLSRFIQFNRNPAN